MKKILLGLLILSSTTWAQSKRTKLANSRLVTDKQTGKSADWNLSGGIILGQPTGFVLKNEFAADQAVDFGLSYQFSSMFEFYADWQYRFPHFLKAAKAGPILSEFEAYVGLGASLLIATSSTANNVIHQQNAGDSFGALFRIPLGIQYKLPTKPFAFFLEIVPGIGIIPGTFGFFEGGIGARYYF